jgi:Tfp pilus assembly protein PilO
MKIKILIFPFCLVLSFVILVMYAKPEFTKIGITKAEIKNKENILSEIKQRNERIDNLIQNLSANQDKENLVLRYLPSTKEEELIINSVFQSVVNSSLYMSNLGITYQNKLFNISPQFKNAQFSSTSEDPTTDPSIPAGPTNIEVINAKLSLAGTYENIKTFLNQIFTMEKESNIMSVRINKSQISSGQSEREGSNANNLNLEISASFDNIPPLKLKKDSVHPAFSRSDFDFSVTGDIEKLFNRKIPAIESGSAGKSNPFLP